MERVGGGFGLVLANRILLDTSAVLAAVNPEDQHHEEAVAFLSDAEKAGVTWCALDVTAYEAFTRARYDIGFDAAWECWKRLRGPGVVLFHVEMEDEADTEATLRKYAEHVISYHDALCMRVGLRNSVYRVFTFDKDFWILGCEVVPGVTG